MAETDFAAASDRLLFAVAGQRLAIPTLDVAEIIRPPVLTRVPNSHGALLGVANLRGAVVPVVSLARMLDSGAEAGGGGKASSTARVVVVDSGAPVGLLVDEVIALTELPDTETLDWNALLSRDFVALAPRGQRSREAPGPRQNRSNAPQAAQQELALMGFMLAGQEYALPLADVLEVVKLPSAVTPLPRADRAMMGVIAIRNRLAPLVRGRVLLGLPEDGADSHAARVVVTRMGAMNVGLVVDAMTAIVRAPADAVDPVPTVMTRGKQEAQVDAICRLEHGRRLISILSPSRLFDAETTRRILAEGGDAEAGTALDRADAAIERFVVFRLGAEHYGVPVEAVQEVVRRPERLVPLPRAPAFLLGTMNLRGRTVPIIDQRARFAGGRDQDLGERGSGGQEAGQILVLRADSEPVGLLVDRVTDVLAVAPADLRAAPALAVSGQVFNRVATVEREGEMVLIVDPKTLLGDAQRDLVAKMARGKDDAGA